MVGVIKGDHGGVPPGSVRIRGVAVAMFPLQARAEVLQLLVEGDDGGQQQGLHHAPHHQHVTQLSPETRISCSLDCNGTSLLASVSMTAYFR